MVYPLRGPPEPVALADISLKKKIAKKKIAKKNIAKKEIAKKVTLPTAVARRVSSRVSFGGTDIVRTPGTDIDFIMDMKTHDGAWSITQMVGAVITAFFTGGGHVSPEMLMSKLEGPMAAEVQKFRVEISGKVTRLYTRLEHNPTVGVLHFHKRLSKVHRPFLLTLVQWLWNCI